MRTYDCALITGASRGLGAALAGELASRGYRLLLVARSGAELQTLAQTLRARHGVNVTAFAADLTDPDALQRCAAQALSQGDVDVLINNAGTGRYQPLEQWTPREIAECTALNLTAPMLLAHALVPAMVARRRGMVVNIASDLARRYLANMAPYVATKFGLLGFSGSLLREVKQHGVKVTAVLPGIVDTGFGGGAPGRDERGALNPEQLAAQIAELLELPPHMVLDEVTLHPLQQQDY
jgi:3-oxoacyl-[acyl-carrier protein] reductase